MVGSDFFLISYLLEADGIGMLGPLEDGQLVLEWSAALRGRDQLHRQRLPRGPLLRLDHTGEGA